MEHSVTDLYSLLIPLSGERLIMPRAAVAEVIAYQVPSEMTGVWPLRNMARL